jgi:hypothetical protein
MLKFIQVNIKFTNLKQFKEKQMKTFTINHYFSI